MTEAHDNDETPARRPGVKSMAGLVAVIVLMASGSCGKSESSSDGPTPGSADPNTNDPQPGPGQPPDDAVPGGQSGGGATGGNHGATTGGTSGGATGGSGPGAADAGSGPTGVAANCRLLEPQPSPGNPCRDEAPPALQLREVVQGLDTPVFLTHAPGDMERLYVVERAGRIRVIHNGSLQNDAFLDIANLVSSPGFAGERGLLGMAFAPDYAESGRFWVNYNGSQQGNATVIASYRATPGQAADPSSGEVLFTVTQTQSNHNGGMIAFGSDDCLYIGMGDGGGSNDPGNHGQNPMTQLGSMLRVDPERYPAPAPGNMSGADPHTWAYGLRNPWRFSFDRATGDLYIGDVGQGGWEEVNVEPAGVGHRNYGWAIMEASHCRPPATTCDRSGKTLPVAEHDNPPHRSVIGGYVYRGQAIPGMVGRYVYGDYRSRTLWSFTWSGETDGVGSICDVYELPISPAADITSFGEDAAGELYVVTITGIIYRIEPA